MMLNAIVDSAKVVAVCCGAITPIATGYVYLDGPLPASKHYVLAQYDALKNRVIDSQIQTNNLNASILRQEQTTRQADIVKESNQNVKNIYQNRLDEVTSELSRVHKNNEELVKERK